MPIERQDAGKTQEPKTAPNPFGEPGKWALNRPVGGRTERPVYNLPGLSDKERLEWGAIAGFVEEDTRKLERVAGDFTQQSGIPLTGREALTVLNYRQREILQEALLSERDAEKAMIGEIERVRFHTCHIPVDTKSAGYWLRRTGSFLMEDSYSRMRRYPPAGREGAPADGIQYEQVDESLAARRNPNYASAKARLEELWERGHGPTTIEDGKYTVAMTRMFRFSPDATILYRDQEGVERVWRLNPTSIGINDLGVFYRGEPSDNVFHGISKPMNWDQNYLTDPEQAWRHHVEGHAGRIKTGIELEQRFGVRLDLDTVRNLRTAYKHLMGSGLSEVEVRQRIFDAFAENSRRPGNEAKTPRDVLAQLAPQQNDGLLPQPKPKL